MRTANTMRRVRMLSGLLVAAGGIAASDVASAQGGALYRWESPDGTVSFTDDAKRIPEAQRSGAATIDRSVLGDYGRFTPTDAAATADQAKRLEERLVALREMNREEVPVARSATRQAASGGSPRIARRIRDHRVVGEREDGTEVRRFYRDENSSGYASLPVDPDGPPVITEQKRVYIPGQPVTRTVVVTRQGDRVLSVVQERRDQVSTLDFGHMSDFETDSE